MNKTLIIALALSLVLLSGSVYSAQAQCCFNFNPCFSCFNWCNWNPCNWHFPCCRGNTSPAPTPNSGDMDRSNPNQGMNQSNY